MASTQPARGMRDFLPADVRKREYVIGIIKSVYESYGFEPLETPAVENLETLTGKYGEEGNQLIFKILKRGEKLVESLESGVSSKSGDRLPTPESRLSDLALRYDLTVPLARVVANNRNELPKFFKRYQIQPVWRADRPAKGRFREFYQCDVDSIGSTSMSVESEIVYAVEEILVRLGFEDFVIRFNHRAVLTSLLDSSGIPGDKHESSLVALDKIDKIGRAGVERELAEKGVSDFARAKLLSFFEYLMKDKATADFKQDERHKLASLGRTLTDEEENLEKAFRLTKRLLEGEEISESETDFGIAWIEEHQRRLADVQETIFSNLTADEQASARARLEKLPEQDLTTLNWAKFRNQSLLLHLVKHTDNAPAAIVAVNRLLKLLKLCDSPRLSFDPSLARGLSYYTGTIMEINVPDLAGSLGGGGRYDGLIGMFGKEQIPACGFSLGLERILVVMDERGMFPPEIAESRAADVLVTVWSEETAARSLEIAQELRANGLRVTVYPQPDKEDKQWKYANSIGVKWICTVNEGDLADGVVSFQDLTTRERFREPLQSVAAKMTS